MFYDQITRFIEDCAGVLRGQGDAKGAERFSKASTHWMRHSHASHAIVGGMPIEIAQQNLGHASLATTTVYVTTEKRRAAPSCYDPSGGGRLSQCQDTTTIGMGNLCDLLFRGEHVGFKVSNG